MATIAEIKFHRNLSSTLHEYIEAMGESRRERTTNFNKFKQTIIEEVIRNHGQLPGSWEEPGDDIGWWWQYDATLYVRYQIERLPAPPESWYQLMAWLSWWNSPKKYKIIVTDLRGNSQSLPES